MALDRVYLSALGFLAAHSKADANDDKTVMQIMDRNGDTWPMDCALLPTTRLATRHPFPQDSRIRFVEATHKYFIDGVPAPVSVTSFIHAPFPTFDTPSVIGKMSARGRADKGFAGLSDQAIARVWKANAEVASRLGTRMHAAIEVALNTDYWSKDPSIAVELAMARDFFQTEIYAKGYQIFRTEPKVFIEPPTLLPGSVDCIFYDPARQEYGILDWKRSKEIVMTANGFRGRGTTAPFDQLENVNYAHYSLQLNLYAYILRTYYHLNVALDKLFIVVFHPNNANHTYQMIPTLNVYAMAEALVRDYPTYLAMALEHTELEKKIDAWRSREE